MFEFLGLGKKKDRTKILIVDDEPNIVRILSDRLEMNDYEIISASNGQEGLERAVLELPDIILLDVTMPVMDGHEMLEAMQELPGCPDIVVIMLTARSQTEDIERAQELGITDYVLKPFGFSDLLAKIERIAEQRKDSNTTWRSS